MRDLRMNTNAPTPPPLPPAYHNNGMITFKSARDSRSKRLLVFVSVFMVAGFCLMQPPLLVGLFIVISTVGTFIAFALIIHSLISNVTYTVDTIRRILILQHPLKTVYFNIENIKSIRRGSFLVERSTNFATSYPNLRLQYDKSKYYYISPQEEATFIKELKALNPNITIGKGLNVE